MQNENEFVTNFSEIYSHIPMKTIDFFLEICLSFFFCVLCLKSLKVFRIVGDGSILGFIFHFLNFSKKNIR